MADVFNLNLSEARDFMLSATGQDWPLQRLIGAGARVAVWLEPPPGASKELIAMAFLGLESGFAAPVLEGGDLQRLRFLRDSGTLSITMRPDDSPLRMSPPAKFVADDLRFSESSLQDIAARAIEAGMVKPASVLKQSAHAPQAAQVTQTAPAKAVPVPEALPLEPKPKQTAPLFAMTKAALIAAHEHHWPTIRRNLQDASQNSLSEAKAGSRDWHEDKAMEWARCNGKLMTSIPAILASALPTLSSLPVTKHRQGR